MKILPNQSTIEKSLIVKDPATTGGHPENPGQAQSYCMITQTRSNFENCGQGSTARHNGQG